MRPENLLLRCYARRVSSGLWYAHCIDLHLDAEAPTLEAVKRSLDDAILSYLQTALDTKDKESLTYLISRPSPLRHRLFYYLIRLSRHIRLIANRWIVFKETIPFHLAHDCA